MNLNKVFVLGNLTQDPQKKNLPSGQPVVNFGVATNRFYTGRDGQKQQEVEFHNVVAFGRLADTISQYLTKGSMILVEGRLRTRNWQDSSGVKHYRTEIIAERMQLGPKGASRPPSETPQVPKTPAEDIPIIEENSNPPAKENPSADEEEIDVKNIPF